MVSYMKEIIFWCDLFVFAQECAKPTKLGGRMAQGRTRYVLERIQDTGQFASQNMAFGYAQQYPTFYNSVDGRQVQ